MEVLHGDIKITLSDQEAIRGLQRTRAQVKRGLSQISREKAIIKIEGDLKDLDRDLKSARAKLMKLEGMQAEVKLGLRDGNFKKEIAAARAEVKAMDGATIDLKLELQNQRQAMADLKRIEGEQQKIIALKAKDREATAKAAAAEQKASAARQAALQAEGRMQSQAMTQDRRRSAEHEKQLRNEARLQSQAIEMDRSRNLEAAKLQESYGKASKEYQRLQQTIRRKRLMSDEVKLDLDIQSNRALAEMEALRAKLKVMNRDAIDVPVDIKERGLERLANLGNLTTRIGPISGSLKQVATGGLVLGPIITGLVGSITALAGAIGAGLTGALGAGAGALGAFGLSLGGVGALTVSLFRDFKNLNTLQDAYHKQVLKTGANSEKAKTKLAEFNHALGEVTPTTREAFNAVGKLQDRWRGLRREVKPEFYDALGQAATTANTDFAVFARGTTRSFRSVSRGFQDWMKGLRSAEGQNVIFRLMDNGNRSITPFMHALGQLGGALGRVMAQFSNFLPGLVTDFDHWATGLGDASKNTEGLSTGVDHLMTSFQQTLGVATAFSRVIIEITRAAMGPGGGFLQDIADGLNGIADSIHNNPDPLRNFFGDSIETTKALFDTLAPLVKLFVEFSTILRPATTAVLSLIQPVADVVQALAGFGPIRTALQAWATIWLFRRGTATAISVLTTAVEGLAAAFRLMNREAAASAVNNFADRTRSWRGAAPMVMPAGGVARAPGPAVGGRSPGGVILPAGAAGAARGVGAAAEGGRVARGFGAVSKGLGALSMGLLGVSAPVAGLGIAAIAAGIGIKKLHDAAEKRAAQEQADTKTLGVPRSKEGQQRRATQDRVFYSPYGSAGDPSKTQANADAINRETKARHASAQAIRETNDALRESDEIQRSMVSTGSQLSNSRLMVESAEKAYAAAVKHSGKNSLDARMALQQLRDARTQEGEAAKQWGDEVSTAGTRVKQAVGKAEAAYKAAVGTHLENRMAQNLETARNAAATFEVNLRRAKNGVETFSGAGVEQIGKFLREYGKIPGVKRTFVQVETQDAAVKLARVITDLENVGKRKTVTRILADAKNPKEALRDLNAAFDRFERRHPTPKLQADKRDAEGKLNDLNKQLSHYGARKPEALLKARDEAQAKLDRLNKQLETLDGKSATVTAHVKFTLPSDFHTDASSPGAQGYGGGGSGDGTGAPNIAAAVKSFAEKNPSALTQMFMGAGGGLGSMPASGSGLNAFNSIATRFGLTIGSGFRAHAITNAGNLSYHAMGRARDFPGPPDAMMAFARFMASAFGARLKELIYTPMGFSIKDGRRVAPYAQADHYDHVHVAMAKGGKVEPGRYTKPHVLFAEESGHPEYFISTNPRDRKRSQGLVSQAAVEVGMASGGTRGMSSVRAPGGGRLSGAQQHIFQQAIAMGKALGAPARAIRAELAALWAESRARNLRYGDASSTGPLQLLSSTARGLNVNPRDTKAVLKLFYTHGFTGKGGAIALARGNKHLGSAAIATMVQGNRDGASTYSPYIDFANRLIKSGGGVTGSLGGGGSTPAAKPAPKLFGAKIAPQTVLAQAQARVDAAQGTQGNYLDDIRALLGYNTREKVKVRVPKSRFGNVATGVGDISGTGRGRNSGNTSRGSGTTAAGHGRGTSFTTKTVTRDVHHSGLVDVLKTQSGAAKNRLGVVNKLLRGRLTKDQRSALLSEQTTLTQTISENRTKIADAKKTAASAQFDRSMRKQGIGSQSDIDLRTAQAASTAGLDDDLAAATAEQKYYQAREAWATRRGDVQGQTDARSAYNSATDKIKSITDQMRQDKFTTDEAWITWAEGQATLTGALNDDFAEANKALEYWQSRVREANSRGDVLGALQAGGNVQQYTDRVRGLKEDMARLPLERDAALAALTDDIADDKAAAIALRDYWASRLEAAKQQGDLQGQIDAAGNLKTLNDEIKGAEESIATQMVLLSQARQDLYKNFGSNFLPSNDIGSVVGAQAGVAGTVVNLTVNGAELAPDPFTWSHNVAWELQAAV